MKKNLSILLSMCALFALISGCSTKIPVEPAANTPEISKTPEVTESPEVSVSPAPQVDVDLTALSSTMIYAEVYNMLDKPEEYMGKTIKMSGPYYSSYYNETDAYYHFVIIEDATACCQSGMEFIWKGEHTFPDDYPEDNQKIEITGVFDSYEELGETYYYLAVDEMLF